MPDDPNVIYVVAERNDQGAFLAMHTFSSSQFQSSRFFSQREVDPNSTSQTSGVVVKVQVANPANRERARQAAERLALVLVRELQRLEAADPNAMITVLGRVYLVGEVLFDLNNTDFIVTDQTDFQNNGVGASSRGQYGARNTDIINMDAILDGYGNPGHPNDIGMTVLVFHELAHMSQMGQDFFELSAHFHNSEPADKRGPFYPSDYSKNNEAFANDFKNEIHSIFGIADGPNPPDNATVGAREPSDIYQDHASTWGP